MIVFACSCACEGRDTNYRFGMSSGLSVVMCNHSPVQIFCTFIALLEVVRAWSLSGQLPSDNA